MPGMPSTPSAVETGATAGIELAQARAVGQQMGLPAGAAEHDVALLVLVIVGGRDLAHRAGFHHLVDADRLGVGRRIAHASAHIGIEREPFGAQQHLPGSGLRNRKFLEAEVGSFRLAHGARREHDAAGGLGHGGSGGSGIHRVAHPAA